MATALSIALKACIEDNWSAVTGGTEPTVYGTDTTDWPKTDEWIRILGWTFNMGGFKRRNDNYIGYDEYISFVVSTKNDTDLESRLDEMTTELRRIITPTNLTGYHLVDIVGRDRSRTDQSRKIWAEEMTIKATVKSTSAAITPGSTTTADWEVDNLTVNTSLDAASASVSLGALSLAGALSTYAASDSIKVGGTDSDAWQIGIEGGPTGGQIRLPSGETVFYVTANDAYDREMQFTQLGAGSFVVKFDEIGVDNLTVNTSLDASSVSGNFDVGGDLTVSGGNITVPPPSGTSALYVEAGDLDVKVWEIIRAGASEYGYYMKYVGTGSNDANYLELWSHNTTDADELLMRWHQQTQETVIAGDLTVSGNNIKCGTNKGGDIGEAGTAFDDVYADDFQNVASEPAFKTISDPVAAVMAARPYEKDESVEWDEYRLKSDTLPAWVRPRIKEMVVTREQQVIIDEETKEERIIPERRTWTGKYLLGGGGAGNYADGHTDEDFQHHQGVSVNKLLYLQLQAIQALTKRIETLEAAK